MPDTSPRAVLAVVHGYGEHSGRYMNMVRALVPHGYGLHAYDLRGHGRSPGRRGHVDRWGDYEDDTCLFLAQIQARSPGIPIFLYGHSLGGMIVLTYGLRRPEGLRGVIASAPALATPNISPFLLSVSRLFSRAWPTLSMPTGLDVQSISRDPEVVNAYRNDPLVRDIGSARLSTELAAAREWALAHASEFQLPLLMVQGGADRLIPPEMGQRFYDQVLLTDKEIKVYPDAYHEVHNDLCAQQVMLDMEHWLERHF
jgi:alpha-beta hydrolase superfamily lysophospholipase